MGFACALAAYGGLILLGLGTGATSAAPGALPPTEKDRSVAEIWLFMTATIASLLGALATGAWAWWRQRMSGALNPLVCWAGASLLFMVLIAQSNGPAPAISAVEPPGRSVLVR